MSRSVPSVSAIYNYSDSQLLIAGSLKLPTNPIGKYLNISTEFSDAGNLFDASSLAALAALTVTKFPTLMENDMVDYKKLTDEKLPLFPFQTVQ